MKRSAVISSSTVVAVTLVAACGKADVATGVQAGCAITLLPQVCCQDAPSRSSADGYDLPDTYTVHTAAYFTATDGSGDSRAFFLDEHFNSTGDGWQSDPVSYWPLGGTLDFLAIACDDDILPLSYADAFLWDEDRCSDAVTVDVPQTQTMQSEVLFASAATGSGSRVSLLFDHSQAMLTFSLLSADDALVRVDDLTVDGIFMNGRLMVSRDGSGTTADWVFSYTVPVQAYVPGIRADRPVLTSTARTERSLIVPAQSTAAITLAYRTREDISSPWDEATPHTRSLTVSSAAWEMGYEYTYNINFGHVATRSPMGADDVRLESEGRHPMGQK